MHVHQDYFNYPKFLRYLCFYLTEKQRPRSDSHEGDVIVGVVLSLCSVNLGIHFDQVQDLA